MTRNCCTTIHLHLCRRSLACVRMPTDKALVASGSRESARRCIGARARYASQTVSSSSSSNTNGRSSSNNFTSDIQASGIARSLDCRISRLLVEEMGSPAMESQASVPKGTLQWTSAREEPDHAQSQLSQWARYRQHRQATHEHAAEVHSLPASSCAMVKKSSSITNDNSQGMMDEGGGVKNSDKLQQLLTLVGPTSKEASAREATAESANLDPGTMHDSAPSRRVLNHQGQADAQVGGQSSHSSQDKSISALPHSSGSVWGSLSPPTGRKPSQVVPVHRQQLLQAGIIGVPNSGKSTLTNALVGSKVSCFSSARVNYLPI